MAEWTNLGTRDELDAVFRASSDRPVVLLKHSLSCGSSKSTLRDLRGFADRPENEAAVFALVEIQNARDLSDEITERTGVTHESPQVIVLRNGRASWHASHWRISMNRLAGALTSAAASG